MYAKKLVLLLCFLLWAPAAAAEPTLQGALAKYKALDYQGAIQVGRAVLARGNNGPQALLKLHELLGQALASVGQTAEAKEHFRRVLALSPDYRLPEQTSPKIRKPLSEVLANWAGRPGLTIAHSPPPSARFDRTLNLVVKVIEDPLRMVRAVRLVYKLPGTSRLSNVRALGGKGDIVLSLPLPALNARPGQLSYRVEVLDKNDNIVHQQGAPQMLALKLRRADEPVVAKAPTPWYAKWWVWTIAGAVVAGAATATVVVLTTGNDTSNVTVDYSVKALRF